MSLGNVADCAVSRLELLETTSCSVISYAVAEEMLCIAQGRSNDRFGESGRAFAYIFSQSD